MKIIVTGGAGFIGSAVCRYFASDDENTVINVDKLTYAGNLASLRAIESRSNYLFHNIDICNEADLLELMRSEQPDAVMHLAAESHVDRSIDGPAEFIKTNVVGTFHLLNSTMTYWRTLTGSQKDQFRFHHISTDEVFGDLPFDSGIFTEETPYAPASPYSASKAASDHLVRAWYETYGLPVVLSNCSNNYGPFHFPEKLIPLTVLSALHGRSIPIYGAGANVRDWLYVDDHVRALALVLTTGRVGESYNIGGRAERTNLSVVKSICALLDVKKPRQGGGSYAEQITFVTDRPGHDRRYAIDSSKIQRELGWKPEETFDTGLERTVDWYLTNEWWWRPIFEEKYAGERLGKFAPT